MDSALADPPAPATLPVPGPGIALLHDVEVKLSVEVGQTTLTIRELLALAEGSVVELDRYATEMLDVLANGRLLARGEVVTVGERLGVRVLEVVAPDRAGAQ